MNTSNTTMADSNSTHHEHKYHTQEHESAVIFFIFCVCAGGALVRRVIQGLNLRLPYTVVLLVLGVLYGLLSSKYPQIREYASVVDVDPHLILQIFLPVLIFESAFAMEVHYFLKTFIQIVLLAIPGLALASLFTCLLARYLFTYNWDWNEGMMFGAILSATDPVAVVAILRDLGASKKIAMVIEGESLLNDGAAIVFFQIFLKLSTTEQGIEAGEIVWYFLRVAVGGPLWGFIMAKVSLFWLSRVFNDALVEITITLATTYFTYYVGEVFLEMSGVLAVVVLGVTMNAQKTMISPEVEKFLHRFWETLAYIANTLIFVIVGMVISDKAIFEIHGIDWFYMFALYFGIFVIRGMVIAIFSPVLQHTGYGMSWQEGIIMTWGGLRGAVSLALALQVAHHDEIDQETVGIRVLVHVSGIVFLTLLINATTAGGLLKVLGMSELSPAKRMAMANSLRFLQDMREKTLNMLKTDRFLADADWDTVEKSCEIEDPYKTTEEEAEVEESLDMRPNTICPECDSKLPAHYTRKELREMTNEAILRMLKAEKMSYWRQFEQGMLSREAVRKLQDCTDVAADKKGKFIDVDEVKKCWEIPSLYLKSKRFIKRFIIKTEFEVPKESPLRIIHQVLEHMAFKIITYIVILLDMVNLTFALIARYHTLWYLYRNVFRAINVAFLSLYCVEAILKFIVQKKLYFKNCWQNFCLAIIFVGIVDMVLSFVLPAVYGEESDVIHIVLVIFILLRCVRLFRLLEPLMPLLVSFMKRVISNHLSYGYDVGRGYVAGEEEVRKLIDHMVDQKEIAKTIKQVSDNGRLDVIRCLGMLQKQHPDIALSIKTRQAVRSVLNNLRDGIHELLMDGILEEAEGHKLEKMVEESMKRLLSASPTLPIPPPDRMLNNVFWLRNDEDLIVYIKEKAKLLNYNYEDVIIREGDPPGGIYIIVSGMVRLQSTSQPGKPVQLDEKVSKTSQMEIKSNLIDFLTAGNIIGEIGLLTRKPRSATVTCETSVQLLFISLEDMEYALRNFNDGEPSLEYRLWHVCANRIATSVLMKQVSYQGWTKEKIKLRLENSYLLDSDDSDVFTVDSGMSDVVLVNGFAQNAFTREQFTGPTYIPWTVLKLDLLPDKGPKVVLLIVPTEAGQPHHTQHHNKNHDKGHPHGAFLNSISQLCLKHASNHRKQVEAKLKKIQQAKSVGVLLSKGRINDNSPQAVSNGSVHREWIHMGERMSTPGLIESAQMSPLVNEESETLMTQSSDNSKESLSAVEHLDQDNNSDIRVIPGDSAMNVDYKNSKPKLFRGKRVSESVFSKVGMSYKNDDGHHQVPSGHSTKTITNEDLRVSRSGPRNGSSQESIGSDDDEGRLMTSSVPSNEFNIGRQNIYIPGQTPTVSRHSTLDKIPESSEVKMLYDSGSQSSHMGLSDNHVTSRKNSLKDYKETDANTSIDQLPDPAINLSSDYSSAEVKREQTVIISEKNKNEQVHTAMVHDTRGNSEQMGNTTSHGNVSDKSSGTLPRKSSVERNSAEKTTRSQQRFSVDGSGSSVDRLDGKEFTSLRSTLSRGEGPVAGATGIQKQKSEESSLKSKQNKSSNVKDKRVTSSPAVSEKKKSLKDISQTVSSSGSLPAPQPQASVSSSSSEILDTRM